MTHRENDQNQALARLSGTFTPTRAVPATGNDVTPAVFDANLKASLPGTGVTSLWSWDNPAAKWYFFAPSLAAQGASALSNYNAGKGYLDFGGKTLRNGTGFWVNR